MYSDRPNAPATQFKAKISEQQKSDRLQILLDLQETYTKKKNEALIGSIQTVIAEGISKRQSSGSFDIPNHSAQWTGRTSTNKIVNFLLDKTPGGNGDVFAGKPVLIKIEKAYAHSLWGKPIETDSTAEGLKGEKSYAA